MILNFQSQSQEQLFKQLTTKKIREISLHNSTIKLKRCKLYTAGKIKGRLQESQELLQQPISAIENGGTSLQQKKSHLQKFIKSIENIPMTSRLQRLLGEIFQPFQENEKKYLENSNKIMTSGLYLSLNATEQVLAELTQHHILIKNSDGQTLKVELDFSIKFQIVLECEDLVKSRKIGFRIFRENCDQQASFYHSNPEIIGNWVKSLRTLINQYGFHKYFKAIRRLGKGQFATVFEVENFETGHKFAVKGFSKINLKRMQKGMESLLNQIKIMRSFTHKNLQKLEGVYETENSIYLVNQLLKGGSLFDRLHRFSQSKKRMNMENVREFMSGLLQGLSHLSENGIVHRDLKLDNIVLRRIDSFEPVIIDFGLATFCDQEQYLYYRCGTPGYVSPEVMTSTTKNKIKPISDIFSAGAIFHHILTQKPAFAGSNPEQVLVQNKSFKFDFNSNIYSTINSEAFDLLCKMLQVDPKQRIEADQATGHLFLTAGEKINSPILTTICGSEKLFCEQQKF